MLFHNDDGPRQARRNPPATQSAGARAQFNGTNPKGVVEEQTCFVSLYIILFVLLWRVGTLALYSQCSRFNGQVSAARRGWNYTSASEFNGTLYFKV